MSLTLYHFPASAPSRSAILTARALNLNVNVKEVNLFAKEQLKPEFLKVDNYYINLIFSHNIIKLGIMYY